MHCRLSIDQAENRNSRWAVTRQDLDKDAVVCAWYDTGDVGAVRGRGSSAQEGIRAKGECRSCYDRGYFTGGNKGVVAIGGRRGSGTGGSIKGYDGQWE